MLIVLSNMKLAQYFEDVMDEVQSPDYGDNTGAMGEQGVINENNFEDYLADENDIKRYNDSPEWMSEIPRTIDSVPDDVIEINYDGSSPELSTEALIQDGIHRSEVISFDYVNKKGLYAGYRTVEPHYIFTARTTNNVVLVSFDLDVGDIRTFILQNNNNKISKNGGGKILPNGVRYEGWSFTRRPEIDQPDFGKV